MVNYANIKNENGKVCKHQKMKMANFFFRVTATHQAEPQSRRHAKKNRAKSISRNSDMAQQTVTETAKHVGKRHILGRKQPFAHIFAI